MAGVEAQLIVESQNVAREAGRADEALKRAFDAEKHSGGVLVSKSEVCAELDAMKTRLREVKDELMAEKVKVERERVRADRESERTVGEREERVKIESVRDALVCEKAELKAEMEERVGKLGAR